MVNFKKSFVPGLSAPIFFIALISAVFFNARTATAQERDLDFYFNQAVKNSPQLKEYAGQRSSISLDSALLRAGQKPQVKASSAGLYAPVIRGYGYDNALTNGQSLEALVGVDYAIVGNQRKNNAFDALRIRGDSVRYAVNISQQDLRKAIAEQYIATYASQQQVIFNREVTRLLAREDTILKKLTRANTYKQTDYLTFLVTFQQQKLQGRQADIALSTDLATLNYLAGIVDTARVNLKAPVLNTTAKRALRSSIFLEHYHLDSVRIENERRAVDLTYQPQLGVFANAGYNSSFVLQPYKNFGTSVGFTISIPLYDGHQKKLQYAKLAIEDRTRNYYRDFFVSQQQQQIDLLGRQIGQTNSLFNDINEQIKFAKSLVDADSKLLQTGDIAVADFVIAITNYLSAQNLLRQTTIDQLRLTNQLNYWNQ